MTNRLAGLFGEELRNIAERWSAAEEKLWRSRVLGNQADKNEAEDLRLEALTEFDGVREVLIKLFLSMLMHTIEDEEARLCFKTHLSGVVAAIIRPELEALARAVVELEGQR